MPGINFVRKGYFINKKNIILTAGECFRLF